MLAGIQQKYVHEPWLLFGGELFQCSQNQSCTLPEYAFLNKCELVADSTVQKLLLFTSSHQLTWLLIFQLPDGCANLQHSFICLRCTK